MDQLRSLSIQAMICGVLLSAVPAWATVSMDLKVGTQTLDNPLTLERTTRPRYEIAVAGTSPGNDQVEVALAFGGCSVAHTKDVLTTYDSYGMLQDTYDDHYRMYDLRLGLRLYPVSPDELDSIHPYVGAGLGYYWLVDDWTFNHFETIDSPYSEYEENDRGHLSISKGLFPFVVAGVDVPLSDQVGLLFEFQHDFQKLDDGADYGGSLYTIGLRLKW